MSSLCNFQCAVFKDDLLASCFGGMHMQQPECCPSFASNWHTETGLPQLLQSKGHLFSAATMMCICKQKKKRAQILVWFVSSDLLSHLFCPLYAHVGTVRVFVSVCGLKVIYQLVTLWSLPHPLGLQEHGTAMADHHRTNCHLRWKTLQTSEAQGCCSNCYKDWVEGICLSCCPCPYSDGPSLVKRAQVDKKHICTSEADGVW